MRHLKNSLPSMPKTPRKDSRFLDQLPDIVVPQLALAVTKYLGSRAIPSAELIANKAILTKIMETPFRKNWQWAIEIEDSEGNTVGKATEADEFQIFARDVSFGRFTIEEESYSVGATEISEPIRRSAGSVTLTLRDNIDNTMAKYFETWANQIFNEDGTKNLPKNYLRTFRLYTVLENGIRELDKSWIVYPLEAGDSTMSYEDSASFSVFTITLKKSRSLGAFITG